MYNLRMLLILVLLVFQSVYSQGVGSYYNPKDDEYRLLGLKRAKELFDVAKSEFDREKQLYEKGLISAKNYDQAKMAFADAEVNYQQALLALLFEQQYVSVVEAIKYQANDGKKHVRLTVANSSGGGGEFKKLINIDDQLFKSLQPEVVNDVYLSLLNDDNAIISRPYETKIEELIYGNPITVDFTLLQDLDAVTVNMIYGSGSVRAPKIFLQKDESKNKVVLQSEQFSQVEELGEAATYNMTMELFSGSVNTYKLEVLNLPKQINRYFIDATTQARLSQFKFTESSQTKNVGLQVFLPDRPTNEVKVDAPMEFYVLAIPNDYDGNINTNKEWPESEIENLGFGYLKLELIPRGIGDLVVKAPQLYFTILPGEVVEVAADIVNEGSRELNNVEFEIDLPLNWTKEVNPRVIQSLDIREEKRIVFQFIPPQDITVGKYDVRIRATSLSDEQVVRAEDKTVTIQVNQQANVMGTIIIVLVIIGIIGGIVVFGIKLTRK